MNCLIVDDHKITRITLNEMLSQIDFINVVGECENPVNAISLLKVIPVDLILLDIEMPEMSGIDFLKSTTTRPLVILITAKTKYAIEAFEHNVVDYIVKPIEQARLLKALTRAKEIFESSNQAIVEVTKEYFFIKEKSRFEKIVLADILYIQSSGDDLTITTKDKKCTARLTLKSFLSRFTSPNFIQINKSCIAAINKIDKIEGATIYINNQPLVIGEIYKDDLLKKINII